MDIDTNSFDKRQSVKMNYNLIAEQYSNEFGNYIEDLDAYEKFEKVLVAGKWWKMVENGTVLFSNF